MNNNLAQFYGWLHLQASEIRTGMGILWRDAILRQLLLIGLLLNSVGWLLSALLTSKVSADIIGLHHNIYFGITLIGSPRQVYFIPLLGLIIIAANAVFSYLIKEESRFFMYLFAVSSSLVNVFLILGVAAIMLINFK
ncbi:hypothetical protein COU01_04150 [Candidatus Falkowbacteria bacterium CG10_big_fil_rev_8_21_14_0_10_44_15]|uniref:Uncharacterized protein n=1 Tax=Candidatus Falkowbacteria bacterium CG10_big_fil_rev_8_21_14_0_10_44_15 TaxID=1974569 RepID=A0A2H0V0W1_9BACT|nr:MAG: hypothetical protein COU01_04150 [Candidatus Falkowbacteria bacterium CG10_big_fil_rev_8_21_14_0_10_44_15]